MTRRRRFLMGGGLILGAMAVAVLPFTLMLLPNPGPVRVARVEDAGVGAYVGTAQASFRLFPYAAAPRSFPRGVPSVPADARLFVRTRSAEDFASCRLARYPSGETVALHAAPESGRSATLAPATALRDGRYTFTAPRGGMYGGTDIYYFRVETASSAAR